jgi:NAD(P)-dependent dehydrogenase (short-subunit alcohol dehydrogenase family)
VLPRRTLEDPSTPFPAGAAPFRLDGRAILVTGASSGVGAATARLLAGLGARVVLAGRDCDRLAQVSGECGRSSAVEAFDLSDLDGIPGWLAAVAGRNGLLSGLAHCAGTLSVMPLRSINADAVDQVCRVNIHAGLMLAKGFRQKSVSAGARSVVFVSSVYGLTGEAAMSAYSAAKGALVALTRSLASELARESIRVNCVAPGVMITPMTEGLVSVLTPVQKSRLESRHPLGFGTPEDAAASIAFLLSDASRWITGTILSVDGGYTAI